MNKKSETLWTITLVNRDTVLTQNSLYACYWPSVNYGAFWGGTRRICQTMPILLTYHNVNVLLIKIAWCPTCVAFEASVDDIYREALYDSHHILACKKRHRCRATYLHITIVQPAKWHDNTNMWLCYTNDVFTFLYRTALLSFLGLAVG